LVACKLEKVARLHVSITKQEARLLRLKNQIPSTSSTLVTIKKKTNCRTIEKQKVRQPANFILEENCVF
jgi:hypothetical protein